MAGDRGERGEQIEVVIVGVMICTSSLVAWVSASAATTASTSDGAGSMPAAMAARRSEPARQPIASVVVAMCK